MKIKLKTACNRDCPDGCGIIASVENGRVVRLQGDPNHPVTAGFLCHRTSRFLDRQYDPHRITQAMIRKHKGTTDDHWQTVPIDEAFDLVAAKLLEFREQFGSASIMNYRCGGSMGMMKYVTDYFFQKFGPVTIKSGDVCAGAGDWAQEQDFGTQDSNDFFDLLNAKTIFLWGKNVYVSHVHLLPVLKKAKSNGTKIVLIDPVKHRTASICDEYFQIAPGADAALAFAMARWLHENGQLDPRVNEFCENYEQYLKLIYSQSFEQWVAKTGLTQDEVIQLAHSYSHRPTTILVGWGMQRRRNGAAIIRAIDALAAVSGNIGKQGAGVSFYFPRKGAFDLSFIDESSAPRKIPEPMLGKGIEQASDPPIKMVFVSAANPVTNIPDSQTVKQALSDRFTVVVDMFMTDTAHCADVILPAATMLEDRDLIGAYGHHYLNKVAPVVDAPDDAMTDYRITQQLARRVGLTGEFDSDANAWMERMMKPLVPHGITFENVGDQVSRNPNSGKIVFEGQNFPTKSGKANLITEYAHPTPMIGDEFPLRLMAMSTDQAQASQWQAEQQVGPAIARIHPDAANGFPEGSIVEMKSNFGSMQVQIEFDDQQRTDVALIDKGGWMSAGRCANLLIQAQCSDEGQCAVYYDTPVKLSAVNSSG